MRNIYKNTYYTGRTKEEQAIINLVDHYFPDCGFPTLIVSNKEYIAIASSLVDLSIGVKHPDYNEDILKPAYRICIYQTNSLKKLIGANTYYPPNSICIDNNLIVIGTGIYGDRVNGNLIAIDMNTKKLVKCSDDSHAISFIQKIDKFELEVCASIQTGYCEWENKMYKFHLNNEFYLNYNQNNISRTLSNEEFEIIEENKSNTVTLKTLKQLLKN